MTGKRETSLTGQTFGKWKVGEYVYHPTRLDHRGKPRLVYICECECGRVSYVDRTDLKNDKSIMCVTCYHERRTINDGTVYAWRTIETNAQKRNIPLLITKVQAFDILNKQGYRDALTSQSICIAKTNAEYRCGYNTASLDRIDSSGIYVIHNIQWLHKDIHRMKGILSQESFIQNLIRLGLYNPITLH